jgi:hypothetical protein
MQEKKKITQPIRPALVAQYAADNEINKYITQPLRPALVAQYAADKSAATLAKPRLREATRPAARALS